MSISEKTNIVDLPAPKDSQSTERAYKLKAFVDTIEQLEYQRRNTQEDIKAQYEAASDAGFDKKALKQLLANRREDKGQFDLFVSSVNDLSSQLQWAEDNPRYKTKDMFREARK